MQDEPAIAPFIRAGIADLTVSDGEIGCGRGAEERGNFLLGRDGPIRRSGKACGDRGGDPPTPRQLSLFLALTPGIWQTVSGKLFHEDKGIEHHLLAPRVQFGDGFDHRRITGGAAIDGTIINPCDLLCCIARLPCDDPGHVAPVCLFLFDLRLDLAGATAQVVAKPT